VIWYLENPQRFRHERESLERLAARAPWLLAGDWRMDGSFRVVWDVEIVTSSRTYPVTLQFPNHFPHSPALVLPRGSSERWSAHQYGAGGELCLEFGPDNWHSEFTGAELLESAFRLLRGESPQSPEHAIVPSRHATTLGQDLRTRPLRLLVTHSLLEILSSVPLHIVVKGALVGSHHEETIVFVIASMLLPDGTEWSDSSVPQLIKQEGYERPMLIVRWPNEMARPSTDNAQVLGGALGLSKIPDDVCYVFVVQGTAVYGHRIWDGGRVSEIATIPTGTQLPRLDAEHSTLSSRRVAVVGCGSLGSKVAVTLARAGVGRFLLVDADLMLPENLVRHELDWREMGVHKTAAVARRIQLVNPRAECQTRQHLLGGQESSGSIETLIGSLAECNLILDATANGRAFGYLCAAACAGTKPVVWAEVFGGGFGGLIARHRPSLEPDPASMRHIIEAWCADQGTPLPPRAVDYETRGEGVPLIADDADVTVIAAHTARLAIDTLIQRTPSMFPYSVYMIGLGQGWIFDQPFDTRPINVGTPSEAFEAAPVEAELASQEMELIFELFTKRKNETASAGIDPDASQT
jgi:sulfur-carrier protein adenylyltransferase/sulfurtransferase